MPFLYSVKKSGNNVVVESQNANAKQLFFGWGSDRNEIEGSFYGHEVRGAWGANRELRWRWSLTPEAVAVMLRNLQLELTDPGYRDKDLEPAARELKRKLQALASQRASTRATGPHGRCKPRASNPRCVEHERDSQVPSCAPRGREKGRR